MGGSVSPLGDDEEELVGWSKDIYKECFSERIMEQTVEIAVPRERAQQWEEVEVPEIIIVSDAVEGTFVGGKKPRGGRDHPPGATSRTTCRCRKS